MTFSKEEMNHFNPDVSAECVCDYDVHICVCVFREAALSHSLCFSAG